LLNQILGKKKPAKKRAVSTNAGLSADSGFSLCPAAWLHSPHQPRTNKKSRRSGDRQLFLFGRGGGI